MRRQRALQLGCDARSVGEFPLPDRPPKRRKVAADKTAERTNYQTLGFLRQTSVAKRSESTSRSAWRLSIRFSRAARQNRQ